MEKFNIELMDYEINRIVKGLNLLKPSNVTRELKDNLLEQVTEQSQSITTEKTTITQW